MSRAAQLVSLLVAGMVVIVTTGAQLRPGATLRELLTASDSNAAELLPEDCLNEQVIPEGSEQYIRVQCHINPSAEQLFLFSRDGQLKGEIFGWELVTLPNDLIVYHDSEVHFAATHPLGISIFDPSAGNDKKIYPPMPYQPVRQAFIQRVAEAYKARGEEWFHTHNHPGDPELFDSSLVGVVTVNPRQKTITFDVQYGDPDNVNDPLPFKQMVHVTCGPTDSLEQLRCVENPKMENRIKDVAVVQTSRGRFR